MLKIAVDHRDEIGARSEPALDHRAGEAEPIDAAEAAQARIAPRDRVGDVGGAVGRIVVDDDHLPRQAGERRLQPLEQDRNIGRFAIGRHDDRQGRPDFRRARYRQSSRPRSGARRFARRPHRGYGRGNACVKPWAGTSASSIASSSAASQGQRLRRTEAGKIGPQFEQRRHQALLGHDDHRVPADEAGAVVDQPEAARIARKNENRRLPAERQRRSCRPPSILSRRRRRFPPAAAPRAARPSPASRASDRRRRRARRTRRVAQPVAACEATRTATTPSSAAISDPPAPETELWPPRVRRAGRRAADRRRTSPASANAAGRARPTAASA